MNQDQPRSDRPRLEHGFTNETIRSGAIVTKRYTGEGFAARRLAEYAALTSLADRLPVPRVLGAPEADTLHIEYIDGTHGQDALNGLWGAQVMRLCGEILAGLQAIDAQDVGVIHGSHGDCLVHGDFGPQNVIISPSGSAVVIDWEWFHLGRPIEDLAWAEWIVRTHHPEVPRALAALFAGYGDCPPWAARHESMLTSCFRHRTFCLRRQSLSSVEIWDRRIAATLEFTE